MVGHTGLEICYISRTRLFDNSSALGEIAYQEPIGSGCKFQDNHICPEKWVLSGQVYILERPHPPKKLPHYYDDPTKGSLEIGAERVRKRVGKNSGREIHTRENSEELEERSNSPLSRGLLGGYTKRDRRI